GSARAGAGRRGAVLARSLAAVARAALRAVGLLLPERHRRAAARARDRAERSMSATPAVRSVHAGAVSTVTLARASMRNALVPDLLLDLCVALEEIARREETRAVVLGADGDAFSIGGDLRRFAQEMQGPALGTYAAELV